MSERYVTDWGPRAGPLLYRDAGFALGVLGDEREPMPVGIAYPVGWTTGRRAPLAVFRLTVRGTDLDARFICVGRSFVELGEAAE